MNVGVRRFQRLSRAEYERVIHDLLGLDFFPMPALMQKSPEPERSE